MPLQVFSLSSSVKLAAELAEQFCAGVGGAFELLIVGLFEDFSEVGAGFETHGDQVVTANPGFGKDGLLFECLYFLF